MNLVTARENQAASYGARSGFEEEPKPGRSMACTVYSGVRAETVSKKLVLLLPSPWIRITVSIPSPAVSVEISALPAWTLWIRSSGGLPLGSLKKPSNATARSRLPRAQRRRERKASMPGKLALAELQPGGRVGPDHDVRVALGRGGDVAASSSSSTAQLRPRSSSSIR